MKSIEELIEEMDNDYLATERDINQSNSFEYMAQAIKDFSSRWREKIQPYSPIYSENLKSGRKLDYNYRLHNNLCHRVGCLKRAMTDF